MQIKMILTEDKISTEPSGYFEYNGESYPYWGNPSGRNSTKDYEIGKFNRYAKLGLAADELLSYFKDLIHSNNISINARCAYACMLMMEHGVRVGNEDSAAGYISGQEDNKGEIVKTYGVTTLLNKHITPGKKMLKLNFLGKKQVEQFIILRNKFLVDVGSIYYDNRNPNNKWLNIDYDMLFGFVKDDVGNFVPKDFRTFCANVIAWKEFKKRMGGKKFEKISEARKKASEAIEDTAEYLGNTPQVARSNYVDNRMIDWFVDKILI